MLGELVGRSIRRYVDGVLRDVNTVSEGLIRDAGQTLPAVDESHRRLRAYLRGEIDDYDVTEELKRRKAAYWTPEAIREWSEYWHKGGVRAVDMPLPNLLPPAEGSRVQYVQDPVFLRLEGDLIVGSAGYDAPVSHFKRIWDHVCKAVAGQPYYHVGHSLRFGSFRVDSITTAGDATVDCHLLRYPELRYIAEQLH